MPQIEVTFDIDANGIVNVSAKDRATNKEQKITITSSGGLSKEDVEKMVQEAAAHEAEDRKLKETIEKRNKLDGLIHDIEKTVNENAEKLPAEELSATRAALETAKKTLAEHPENDDELTKATEELLKASHKVAEIQYKQEQEKAGAAGGQNQAGESQQDQGPIDVEGETKE